MGRASLFERGIQNPPGLGIDTEVVQVGGDGQGKSPPKLEWSGSRLVPNAFIPSAVQAAQREAARWVFLFFFIMDEVLRNLGV
jgi:hypothetical protein